MTALLKSKKVKPFLQTKIIPAHKGNTQELVELLEKIDQSQVNFSFRCFVKSLTLQGVLPSTYSPKSLIRYITKNGHEDLSVWLFVNPQQKITEKMSYGIRSKWIAVCERNMVLDLDDTCGFTTIDEVLELYKNKDLPLPNLITQTGPSNFHVLVLGVDNQWSSIHARVAYVSKLFDYDYKKAPDMQHVRHDLMKLGVDYNYLCQGVAKHKIRLGGSINTNHVIDGRPFITKTWVNTEKSARYENVISSESIEEIKKKFTPDPKDYSWKNKEEPFKRMLTTVIGRKYAKKYARFFCENLTLLRDGKLGIPQINLAERLGITQRCVSKHLQKMVTAGILKTDHQWEFKSSGRGKCKVYGIGFVTIHKIFEGRVIKKIPDLSKPYNVNGETNNRLMSDILRYLQYGVDESSIIKISLLKLRARPPAKRRTAADIKNIIRMHKNRLNINSVECKLNIDEHLEEIGQRL